MILAWLNGREAAEIGTNLAEEFAPAGAAPVNSGSPQGIAPDLLGRLLRRADREVRPLQLNFYKKAKLANSFKWKLIENGVARDLADSVTQTLVMHLSQGHVPAPNEALGDRVASGADRAKAKQLFYRGNKAFSLGAYAEAAAFYEQAVELDSSQAEALNNLGWTLYCLARYEEAEQNFRQAIATRPDYADAHGNLGNLLRLKGHYPQAEAELRLALKLRPKFNEARVNLGMTLMLLGRLRDARASFTKALKAEPRNAHALFGLGRIAVLEGRFDEAESTFQRTITIDPRMASAWAALPGIRKMTPADIKWLNSAEELVQSGVPPLDEADLRFAMGKFCDDVSDFTRAFQNFQRGNALLKAATQPYDRKQRTGLIDALIRTYTRQAISKIGATGSCSTKPVFVVGMPRSGTSLAEQIIASHPAAHGAGELDYWSTLIAQDKDLVKGVLSEPARLKAADEYLRTLERASASALRIVDKAPDNSDFLGMIYSVFPNARVIYMRRDPIDTCLSCYFQQFLSGLNYTFDLSDLAHYFREHRRIVAHWNAVLPPEFILEVPYEELVADQETWSRRMLDFIGLEWDPRCLGFHETKRQVLTASAWQVRQKIYGTSVARWRNYEKFLGPLKALGS